MKRAVSLALAALFTMTILGCHASVDTDDATDSHYKKTTTYDNGSRTTKTETKVERNY
jgi:hypothetical protein